MQQKRFKQLDRRLTAIAELVREGTAVCDVGTDHAHLPCYLARRGRNAKIYASELNPKPLQTARAQIKHQGVEVTLIQSDGLENVPPCDDVIIAGMGGELIAEIVGKMPSRFKSPSLRLILQPMTRKEKMLQSLNEIGFEVIEAKIVFEKNRRFFIYYCKIGESVK